MNIFQGIFFGALQGLTEFLPVSSSGHLALFQKLFGITEPAMTFDVILHIGTLIPILIIFSKDIIALLKKPFQKMTYLLIAGTIPTVIIALLFKDVIETAFEGKATLGIEFIITGLALLFADKAANGTKRVKETTYLDAGIIGICQGIAILPAISRSGMTITGALVRGMDRGFAAKYSFLLSIPAILGALVLQLKDVFDGEASFVSVGVAPTIFGFLAAMVTGYIAVRFMMNIIRKGKLRYFSYYVFLLGILIILDQTLLHIYF